MIDSVMVNWNTGTQLEACLESIASAQRELGDGLIASVTIVDNASTDGSASGLASLGLPLRLIQNKVNAGFAKGCNQAAAAGCAPYVLLLNPDTLVTAEALARPVAFLEQPDRSEVGICGVRLLDANGQSGCCYARFPTPARLLCDSIGITRLPGCAEFGTRVAAAPSSGEVDQVIGAFYLVRRNVYTQLAGMDERFFLYFEEVDFSLRARHAGFKSYFLADVTAFHWGHGSSHSIRGRRLFYSLRSRLQFARKHFSLMEQLLLLTSTFLVEPWVRLLALLAGRSSWSSIKDLIDGYRMLLSSLRDRGAYGQHS